MPILSFIWRIKQKKIATESSLRYSKKLKTEIWHGFPWQKTVQKLKVINTFIVILLGGDDNQINALTEKIEEIDKSMKNLDKRFAGLEKGMAKVSEVIEKYFDKERKSTSPDKKSLCQTLLIQD